MAYGRSAGRTPTGWAILGTGPISRKFAMGLRAGAGHVKVIGSRDLGRAQAMAAVVAPDAVTTATELAVTHAAVSAVYIVTPPALHEEHALMAIAAGKAVLVEKPLADSAAAARRIVDAARAAGVFAMEAMWTRFMPLTAILRDLMAAGELGEHRAFAAEFMGSDSPDVSTSLFDPARGGGALLHRGIYPLSLAMHLMGPVSAMAAAGRIGATGVDEEASIILTHTSGAISTLRASLRAGGSNSIVVSGTHATIRVDPPVWRPFRATLVRHTPRRGGTGGGQSEGRLQTIREGGLAQGLNRWLSTGVPAALRAELPGGATIRAPYAGNGYGHEAAEVARCLAAGLTESPLMPLDESVAVLALIDQARAVIKGLAA